MSRAYAIPFIAMLTFVLGTVSLMLPFLPFGWALYALTALLLIPYIKPLRKVFKWVAEKDSSGTAVKVGYKIAALYRWSHKSKLADEVTATVKEAEENNNKKECEKEAPRKEFRTEQLLAKPRPERLKSGR